MNKRTLKRLTITTFVMLSVLSIPFTPWIVVGELLGVLAYVVWLVTGIDD